MTSLKTRIWGAVASVIVPGIIFGTVLLHEVWGDERYVLKEEDRIAKIAEYDDQIAIKDTEILFAEDEREKEKLETIKRIYERRKEALKEKSKT